MKRDFGSGDLVRHIDGREGVLQALIPTDDLTFGVVIWDRGDPESVPLGYLERLPGCFVLGGVTPLQTAFAPTSQIEIGESR